MIENKECFFTIITPTYNRAATLGRAFCSLQNQTFQNFEWIIGDDGSIDDTQNLINSFQKQANFTIRYYKFEHRGKAATQKDIFDAAKGEYIILLDSDDELYDEYTLKSIENKINSLDKNKNFWGICGCFIDQNDNIISKFNEPYIDITKDNYFDLWINKPNLVNISWVFKNGLFKLDIPKLKEQLPYYPEVLIIMKNILESNDFCFRLFNEPVYRYHTFNNDCVSLMYTQYPMFWYETVGMINIFCKYQLSKKYKKFFNEKIKYLARDIYEQKGFVKTFIALEELETKIKFVISFILQNIFAIRNSLTGKHKVITILGIKFKIKRG